MSHIVYIVISIIALSQVNANLCSLQYALNGQLTATKFLHPWFSQKCCQNLRTGARQKNILFFLITIHDFHEQNYLFRHLNSICCKLIHWCYNYKHCTTTKTKVFASVRSCHRTLQLAVAKHSFLSKCWFVISDEHNNSLHLKFNYKLQT